MLCGLASCVGESCPVAGPTVDPPGEIDGRLVGDICIDVVVGVALVVVVGIVVEVVGAVVVEVVAQLTDIEVE